MQFVIKSSVLFYLFCFSFTNVKAIEYLIIKALPYYSFYVVPVSKHDINKLKEVDTKIYSPEIIDSFKYYFENAVFDTKPANMLKDFRACIIVKSEHGKKDKYYLSSNGYIVFGNRVYKPNSKFVAFVYAQLPTSLNCNYLR